MTARNVYVWDGTAWRWLAITEQAADYTAPASDGFLLMGDAALFLPDDFLLIGA